MTVFALVVATAAAMCRQTQWHWRLMFAATAILRESALERILPMPLLDQTSGGWIEAALQIGFLGIVARHDPKVLGCVHAATFVGMGSWSWSTPLFNCWPGCPSRLHA